MRRFTIMGFTEAELGFVLAALFVGVAATAVHERDASAETAESLRDAAAEADSMRIALDEMRTLNDRLRDSVAALERKISTKVPQCWEKGEQSAPVAEVDVVGSNRYVMNGQTLSIEELRERLAPFIDRGNELGCRFIVRARPTARVNAMEQSDAVWRLRQYFDVNDRPR